MSSSVIFVNQKGDILIYRRFRDDVSRAEVMNFCDKIVATKAAKETPIICLDGVSFLHTTYNDITVIATTKGNINAALIIQFLYDFISVCKAYFNGEFNESHIRKNFALIYELLDEVMDYGYPQILDPDLLKMYITMGKISEKQETNIEKLKQITIQATGSISWRAEGIKYRYNELFIDIIESVNVLISNRGTVLKSDVVGQVIMKTQLTGMPECKFGINDKLLIRDNTNAKDGETT
jgi:AP-2 complex subunit mu-1